jgi:ABC-type dipeptide/oligopeptide/nickel transport system permease component
MTLRTAAENERGIALLSTMLTLMLLTAIGMAMMFGSNMETMINANYRDKQRAQYASVAGVQEARDRIQPVNVVAKLVAPLVLPALGANNLIYIVNPRTGDPVEPWNPNNPYFDNELCQEHVLGLTGTFGVPCTSIAAGSWYTAADNSLSSAAPWNFATPLATKWTRIMLKANNMGVVPVNGTLTDAMQVCWDGNQQITLPSATSARIAGPATRC